jgi:hypothetical protein
MLMLLYHASLQTMEKPIIFNHFKTLDFGAGFYTTPNEGQARDFAIKAYLRRGRTGKPTINAYEYDAAQAVNDLTIRQFGEPDKNWLNFVVANRRNGRLDNSADIIIGPVANDDVFEVIALYEGGQIDADTAIKRFKVKRLFNQILFCNTHSLEYLRFKSAFTLEVPR